MPAMDFMRTSMEIRWLEIETQKADCRRVGTGKAVPVQEWNMEFFPVHPVIAALADGVNTP